MPGFEYSGRIPCSKSEFKHHASFDLGHGAHGVDDRSAKGDEAMGQFGRLARLADLAKRDETRQRRLIQAIEWLAEGKPATASA